MIIIMGDPQGGTSPLMTDHVVFKSFSFFIIFKQLYFMDWNNIYIGIKSFILNIVLHMINMIKRNPILMILQSQSNS